MKLFKKTSAILELYFRFRFDLLIVTGMGILHWRTKFEVSASSNRSRDMEGYSIQ